MLELIEDMNSYLETDPEEFETIILVSINNFHSNLCVFETWQSLSYSYEYRIFEKIIFCNFLLRGLIEYMNSDSWVSLQNL